MGHLERRQAPREGVHVRERATARHGHLLAQAPGAGPRRRGPRGLVNRHLHLHGRLLRLLLLRGPGLALGLRRREGGGGHGPGQAGRAATGEGGECRQHLLRCVEAGVEGVVPEGAPTS